MTSDPANKLKLVLFEGNKGKEANTASVIDIDDGEVINIGDDDDLVILGNEKRKGREDDDDDDGEVIDENGVAVDVESLRASKWTTTKKQKLVKATKKGAAVLDQYVPDNIKAKYHVLKHGGEIYDAVLNQANVSDNSNKFYVIQALESDSGEDFMVFSRWGRVGLEGQNKLHGPFTSLGAAIQKFELMFYAKTHNVWSMRKNFVPQPKLYTWLEMDYSSNQPRGAQLDSRVANFISLIYNLNMKYQMVKIEYNAENLPLGKLSKSTILKGHDILKSISKAMTANPNRRTLEQLTGAFYTVIPHDFGSKNIGEFIIDTPQKLKSKIEMVEALGEIKLLDSKEDMLYTRYNHLRCELQALDAGSEEYLLIEKYMKNTSQGITVDIVNLFRVSRKCEDKRFNKYSNIKNKNRMLLWHGSRLANWTGILSQGLRAPAGRGAYFADMFAMSAGFCYIPSGVGVLVLCEVALGEEARNHRKVDGLIVPDPDEFETLDDGVIVPLGRPKKQYPYYLGSYNEYIIDNVDQIRMRYLIHVNFK